MALKDNIVTPEVKANGYGGVDKDAARQVDRPDRADLRVQERASRRRPTCSTPRSCRRRPTARRTDRAISGDCRVRVRRARWGQPRLWRGQRRARGRRAVDRDRGRRVRRRGRAVRLRQVHPDEARDRPAVSVQGHGAGRGRSRSASRSRSPAWRSRRRPCCRGAPRWKTCCCRSRSSSRTAAKSAAASAEYVARAENLLASVGLGGQGDKFPWELSGGMQQRTSLCRALIHEPQLLMLDEPFGALDAFTREELWCVIRDLHAARKITVCLVTHDLREAVFLADRVFVMSARPGRIVVERKIDIAAAARSRRDLHAGLPGHRARVALAYREGAAMNRDDAHRPRWRRGSSPSPCSSSGKRRSGCSTSRRSSCRRRPRSRRPSSNTGRPIYRQLAVSRCRPR